MLPEEKERRILRWKKFFKKVFTKTVKVIAKVAKIVAPIAGALCYTGVASAVACPIATAATLINVASDCRKGINKKCGISVGSAVVGYAATKLVPYPVLKSKLIAVKR